MDEQERVARRTVAEAGARLRAAWSGNKIIHYKGPVDLVTDTDREVEALVVGQLHRTFPDHRIVAEEASPNAASRHRPAPDEYVWYLDPLDGTINFAHGVPHFAVSLALARGSELQLGLVYDALRDELFVARRGNGATLNGVPIRVSAVERLEHALLATGLPYDRRERTEFYLAFVAAAVRHARDVRRFGSAALDLCYVACGRYDGFWEWHLHPWDTAAGALIVCEAGGTVTDFRGGPFDLYGEQTLASNARIHALLAALLSGRLDSAAVTG